MNRFFRRAAALAAPRNLLFGMVAVGLLSSQSAPGTLAFFTSSTQASAVFQAGTLDIVTSSTLPSSAQFKWDTTGAGSNCRVISGLNNGTLTNQRMAPNQDCTQLIKIENDGNLNANARIRIVRSTASDTGVNDALNARLTLTLAELTGSTSGQGTTADCTTTATMPFAGTNWTTLYNGAPFGTADGGGTVPEVTGVGLTGGGGTATSGNVADAAAGTAVVDLWGGTAGDNAPSTTKVLSAAGVSGDAANLCLRVTFPNAGIPTGNALGDNLAQNGANTYVFKFDAIQAVGR